MRRSRHARHPGRQALHRRRRVRAVWLIVAPIVLLLSGARCTPLPPATTSPPNIVLIMLDDMGYGDLGAYGGAFIATPRLDALAASGTRFSQFYANAPTCSSSRGALLTGRYPAEFGFRKALRTGSERGVPADLATLADVLSAAGYATGHFGKWHIGNASPDFLPSARGFDRSAFKRGGGPGTYLDQVMLVDGDHFEQPPGHLTDVTTDYAIDFVTQNQSGPFFLQVWYHAPHNPPAPLPEWADQYPDSDEGRYAALVSHADAAIGEILDSLEDLGLADDTLIAVGSDNGAWSSAIAPNGALRGQKDQLYEGGIRVPLIVRWTGEVPAGEVNEVVTSGLDLLPTLARAAGADASALAPQGRDLLDAWRSNPPLPADTTLFWEDKPRLTFFVPPSGRLYSFAVRRGSWKLVHAGQTGAPFLFDLEADPGETSDLASQNAALSADLLADYRAWRTTVGRIPHEVDRIEGAATRRRGGVLEFAGGAIVLADDTRFDFAEADFSAHVRFVVDALGEQVIAERPESWRLWLDAAGLVHLEVQGAEEVSSTLLTSTLMLSPGVVHEVSFSVYGWIHSPSTVRLYVDGVLQTETNEIDQTPVVAPPVRLGNSLAGDLPLGGEILELDFFRMSLSPDEVRDLDLDGWDNLADNCWRIANAIQTDADGDAAGNACDGDFDSDTWVGRADRDILLACTGHDVGTGGGPSADPTCSESDMNDDAAVDAADLALFEAVWDPRPVRRCGAGGLVALVLPGVVGWRRRRQSRGEACLRLESRCQRGARRSR